MADNAGQAEALRMHVVVHGRVQGVNFRSHTARRALSLGLTGWVRNLPDGSVEAVFEGPRVALENMLGLLHSGPPSARVTSVDTNWGQASGEFADFRVHLF